MTRKEAAGVIKFEKACVLRQDTPRCNRDCKKCDLLLPTEDVLTAYDMAIKALEQQPCEDTISRQAAIDAIMGQPPEPHYPSWYAAQIEKLPPAQPEITRCKDCEHWTNDDCPFAWGKVEDAFCSYAERRTDESNMRDK